jgi:hypothetical protein
VRQLFQVALEMETPGNVWGIGFPPEDWFAGEKMAAAAAAGATAASSGEPSHSSEPGSKTEVHVPLTEQELAPASGPGPDNLRVFPAPASSTDAALQLSRHVTRLVADAKQQIQAATRDAATHAVAEEHRAAMEQLQQKFSAVQEMISRTAVEALERVRKETDEHAKIAQQTSIEALRQDLPDQLRPQLEKLAADLTSQLAREGAVQRAEHEKQIAQALDSLRSSLREFEEVSARLRGQARETEKNIADRAAAALQQLDEAAKQRTQAAESSLQAAVENSVRTAQERSVESLLEKARELFEQLHKEGLEQHSQLAESSQAQARKLESVLAQAVEASTSLEQYASRMATVQHQAVEGFQSQLDDVLSVHRNELHRRSEVLFEELNNRVRSTFEETNSAALANFRQHIEDVLGSQVTRAEEAVHRLAGGRSLLDAALTLQQDRIRTSADDAFAESMGRFRENLGSVEQILQDSAQTVIAKNLEELESQAGDLKHRTMEDLYKSAEWYEKKGQTHLQQLSERVEEQTGARLREKAGEISSLFASELSQTNHNFLEHTQSQLGETVREAFERARLLFAEVSDTTTAAFTDEIQRTARNELDGFTAEVGTALGETRQQMNQAREELTRQVTVEQEEFLRRFQAGMSRAVETGIAEAHEKVQAGLGPMLDSWKGMTAEHQERMRQSYAEMNDAATGKYRERLENVSNSWMLAAAATLDHESRGLIDNLAKSAEERLRETCTRVFAGIGDSLRERLQQIATSLTVVEKPHSDQQPL